MKGLFVSVFIIIFTAAAFAQESAGSKLVLLLPEKTSAWGVDPQILKGKDEKKIFFEIGAGYGLKIGNTNSNDIDAETRLSYYDGIFEFIAHAEIHYGELSGIITENNFRSYINIDYYIIPRLEVFGFTKFEYDTISGINFRNNTGAGLKFVILRNWLWLMDISAAPTFQYEQSLSLAESINTRLSFRYKLKIHPVKAVQFNFVLFYIPNILDFLDYRYDVNTYIKFALFEFATGKGSGLYLRIGYKRQFNAMPAAGIRNADNNFYTMLTVKF